MATAKKLPSGNYRCLVYTGKENGKRQYKSFTATTKKEAEYQASMYIISNNDIRGNSKNKALTLKEAMENYINSKNAVLSPTTIKEYARMKDTRLQTLINKKVNEITNDDIQIAINEMSKRLSPKTVRNTHGFLSVVMKEYTDINIKTKLPQKRKPIIHIPSNEDINSITETAKNTFLELPVLLAAYLGLRRSEICALTWNDIDFKKRTIRINKAMVVDKDKNEVVKQPKTYTSNRTIEAPDKVLSALQKHKGDGKERIYPHKPYTITDGFAKLISTHNLPPMRFHDLRHYYASVMLSLNIPDKYAMERMGHATNNMLKTVYQHTMQDKQKEVSKTINAFFDTYNTKCNTVK